MFPKIICQISPKIGYKRRAQLGQHQLAIIAKCVRMSQNKLNIGIIGAGVGGLCAARRSIEAGHSATVFEVTSNIGGTWNYTDAVGVDEFGIDIQTSMYSGLR